MVLEAPIKDHDISTPQGFIVRIHVCIVSPVYSSILFQLIKIGQGIKMLSG